MRCLILKGEKRWLSLSLSRLKSCAPQHFIPVNAVNEPLPLLPWQCTELRPVKTDARGHHENTVQSPHLFGLIGFCIIRLWLCVSLVFFQTVNRHFIDTNINGDQPSPSPSPSPFPPPPPPYSPSMHTTCVSHKFIRNVQLFIFLIRHLETRT